jgi:hypothetical protein
VRPWTDDVIEHALAFATAYLGEEMEQAPTTNCGARSNADCKARSNGGSRIGKI